MSLTLIETKNPSGVSSVEFTSGINSTYKTYLFKVTAMHPATSGVKFEFQGNVSGASGYNEQMLTTYFRTYVTEDGSQGNTQFETGDAQSGTGFQPLSSGTSNHADAVTNGELWLFNPSSTTFVTNFHSRFSQLGNVAIQDDYAAGFFDVTGAITDIKFQQSSGNFDATISLYGLGE